MHSSSSSESPIHPHSPASPLAASTTSRRVPLALKVIYTAFVCVLVPYYWQAYGPTNFLYFCDVALLIVLGALWLESPLLASMPAVGILLPQAFWCIDFLSGVFGFHPIGLTEYMFNPNLSLFTRGLSFFHFWLPFVIGWLVWRIGYDRRALVCWTVLAWALMLVSYFLMPAPPAPLATPNLPVNIDYVYGFSDKAPQHWMNPLLFMALMMVAMPTIVFLPTHLILKKVFRPATARV